MLSSFLIGERLLDNCRTDKNFLSLGGLGGHLIVRMEAAIEAGDQVTVLEIGLCEGYNEDGPTNTAFEEDVEVFVSVGSELDNPHWESLGSGAGSPDVSFTVPALPDVALGE